MACVAGENRDSDTKVFCFFSSEKKKSSSAMGAICLVLTTSAHALPYGVADDDAALVLPGVDLTDPGAVEKALAAVAARFGCVDALFNVARRFTWQKMDAAGSESWSGLFKMNTLTALNASRAALPHLKASDAGRIVNVGANCAVRAGSAWAPYAASKAGVH